MFHPNVWGTSNKQLNLLKTLVKMKPPLYVIGVGILDVVIEKGREFLDISFFSDTYSREGLVVPPRKASGGRACTEA